MSKSKSSLIAALDIGSTKMCCFIAKIQDDGAIKTIGLSHQLSRGVKNGVIVDMEAAEHCIRQTLETAEQMAGERVREVVTSFICGQPQSRYVEVETSVSGHEIGNNDIRKLMDYAYNQIDHGERELIHLIPTGYSVDGSEGIKDPRGMFGQKLGVSVHMLTAAMGPIRNLVSVVSRCHLDIEAKVVSPYASGLASLVDDEKELGAVCIDMGGGSTSFAIFLGGRMIHANAIPLGGQHVTNDIARGLSTPVFHAERLKTLYGSCLASAADEREIIKVPLVGEEEEASANQIPRSLLVQIIEPRVAETLEMVKRMLEKNPMYKLAGRRIVLTGGASQMQGLRDLAAKIFDKQVRLGKPIGFGGLAEATSGPAFATCAGLLRYINDPMVKMQDISVKKNESAGSKLGRLGLWFKENF